MAIAPLLYEKVSGRRGDPHARLGQALAGSDEAKSRRTAGKDIPASARLTTGYLQYRLIMGGAVFVVMVIAVLLTRLFR